MRSKRKRRWNGRSVASHDHSALLDVVTAAGRSMAAGDDRLGSVVRAAVEAGFDAAALCVLTSGSEDCWVTHASGVSVPLPYRLSTRNGIAARARREVTTVIVADYAGWDGGIRQVREMGFRTTIATPVRTGSEGTAVLVAAIRDDRAVSPQEVQTLEILAAHASGAVGQRPDAHLRQLHREHRLRDAIRDGELALLYQPLVDAHTGAIVGAEALVRWDHPDHGRLPPDMFIPFAEDSGLIDQLGVWVLERACSHLATWDPGLWLCVNISAHQLRGDGLADDLPAILSRHGIRPDLLVLELTEGTALRLDEGTADRMRRIRRIGVRLAVDDFGRRYASLEYLKSYPFSILKIDRLFVSGVERSEADRVIVRSVIGLAKELGLDVVAEGVETPGQLDFLREAGCAIVQGFGLHRPLEAEAMPDVLSRP